MKKITIILLAVLVLCVPCMTAYAEAPEQKGATISVSVPAAHVITFISSGGRIEDVDGAVGGHKEYGRRSEQTFHIITDDGKKIDNVLYGGEDVTSKVKDGYFTTPPIVADTTLEVIYKDAGTSSEPVSEPDISKPDSSTPDTSKPDTSKPEQSVGPQISTPQSSDSSDTARTGDTTMTIVFVIATVTAVSAAFIIVLAKRRKETE